MSVRFDAANEYVGRNATAPGEQPLTVFWRAYVVTLRSAVSVMMQIGNGGGTSYINVDIDASNNLTCNHHGTFTAGNAVAASEWINFAYVRNGSSHTIYRNGTAEITFTDSTSYTNAFLIFGGFTNFFNGRVTDARCWTAALSQSEIQAENASPYAVVRTSNLWAAWPLQSHTTLTDSSGNSRDLTAGGTLSTEINAPSYLTPTGLASGVAFGAPAIGVGAVTLAPAGLSSTVAFGAPTVSTTTPAQTLSPPGIASTVAFGAPTVSPGAVTVAPPGIVSTVAFGAPAVSGQIIKSLSDLAYGRESWAIDRTDWADHARGAESLTVTKIVAPSGIASVTAFGSPAVTPGAATLSPGGIASTVAFGSPTLSTGAVTLQPSGVASIAAFGAPTVAPGAVALSPAGVASTLMFGAPSVSPGAVMLTVTGLDSSAAFGSPTVTQSAPGETTLLPEGIASTVVFGSPTVTPGAVTLQPSGIASGVMFGSPVVSIVTPGQTLAATGIASTVLFGGAVVTVGAVVLNVTGIASTLTFGHPVVTGGEQSGEHKAFFAGMFRGMNKHMGVHRE